MQTGHLILEDLAKKLKRIGSDYYDTTLKNVDEISIHLGDLDKSIFFLKNAGISIAELQNIIIRAARLIEAYQVKMNAAQEEAEKHQQKKIAAQKEEANDTDEKKADEPAETKEEKKPTPKRGTQSKK